MEDLEERDSRFAHPLKPIRCGRRPKTAFSVERREHFVRRSVLFQNRLRFEQQRAIETLDINVIRGQGPPDVSITGDTPGLVTTIPDHAGRARVGHEPRQDGLSLAGEAAKATVERAIQ